MQYIVMSSLGQAQEVLLNNDPQFPDTPLEDRYTAEFLEACLVVDDSVEVIFGYLWDSNIEKFVAPPQPEPQPEPDPDPDLPPTPTTGERIHNLESQLKASIQTNAMLEECLIEMASIVYA